MNEQNVTEIRKSQNVPLDKGSLDTAPKKAWRPADEAGPENIGPQKSSEKGSQPPKEISFHTDDIQPGLKVYAKGLDEDSDDEKNCVGTVDHMDGDKYIKLAKSGSADGNHHWVPIDWVDCVEDGAVHLKKSLDEVHSSMFNSLPIESLN